MSTARKECILGPLEDQLPQTNIDRLALDSVARKAKGNQEQHTQDCYHGKNDPICRDAVSPFHAVQLGGKICGHETDW